jgi:3-hydroxyisobutyrate dehydrogenase
MRLLFIGVGKMGLPMSHHLLGMKPGVDLRVFDVDEARRSEARALGLEVIETETELKQETASADCVCSSLPHDAALLSVGELVSHHAKSGALFLDTSTVSMKASAHVALSLAQKGVDYLRVTVSGNNHMAQAANLTIMCSGPQPKFEWARPIFNCWGTKHFYLGEGEQSRLMKLVVNLLIVQTSAMLAEGLTLGQKGGLDWAQMWQVIAESAVGSPIIKAKSQQLGLALPQRDFTPTFTVPQMLKDLSLMLDAGRDLHVPLMQTSMTEQWMQAAMAHGDAQEDYATVIKVIERMSQ